MNTDARRKASAAYHSKREADGFKKVTLWLHEDTRAELDRLATVYGSKDRAASIAIDHHSDGGRKAETNRAEKTTPAQTPPPDAVTYGYSRQKPGSRLKGAKK